MAEYATLAELKHFLRRDTEVEDADDDLLTIALTAAQNLINTHCNQVFVDPIPEAVKMATMIQASRLYHRRDTPYGVAGSPEMGNELRLLSRLDPDVQLLLSTERNWWGAV